MGGRKRPLAVLAISAALALSGCVSAPAPTDRDCFLNRQINGYSVIDNHHVRVSVGANRHYVLTTDWNAHDLEWGEVIAIRSSSDWICAGSGLGVDLIGGQPRRRYPVSAIAPEAQMEPGG